MAPDVQMRLSFPKRSSSQSNKSNKTMNLRQTIEQCSEQQQQQEIKTLDNHRNDNVSSHQKDVKPDILSTSLQAHSIKINPKRSLTRNYFGSGIIHYFSSK